MRGMILSLLVALIAGVLLAPVAAAHEPTSEELEAMISATRADLAAVRTLAQAGLGAGVLGMALAGISLAVRLGRR